ncbi:phosphoribosylamine--glycine ligase [Pseudoflavitalea sp. G-6-1-2]|uniref:phosphoribosylamine--glycine ligase n=1 Tax=Pseudoflavitalea sp. G-6-1-2 TaxID=2728841 RepID=UPI00146D4F13|nr:phosphoribosylamine--glycine ligase [Pseudoflavitalea sp. G-6-1-2]NML19478.1 phosphoribosylamine--glycine ligase [Pseudoflavitalea sp. G-6-1-2]
MNILLLGSGGREHALAWKLVQSTHCDQLFIAPGNAGTASVGTNVALSPTDFPAIKDFVLTNAVGLVVVGPEEPLVKGITDFFRKDENLQQVVVIGPSQYAAQLEGSKAFAKQFMERHNIPTAAYREFDASNYEEGVEYLKQHALPVVLKADGLAAGKGVLILDNTAEAIAEFEQMIKQSKFGDASKKVVVEAFLSGIELSVFALTDGKSYVILPEAKDYKRIGEGDTGLNTGGMGAVSPVPFADASFMQKVEEQIIRPTIKGLEQEKFDYTGFVFFGLIKVGNDPFVIEYNCRMGDPETEVVMPRLDADLVELLLAADNGTLLQLQVDQDPRVACTVMAVSGGYPGSYNKDIPISGLDTQLPSDSLLFHAGTGIKNGQVVTAGGRVLCVTSYGTSVQDAVSKSRKALENISYEGIYYRKDIGYEF